MIRRINTARGVASALVLVAALGASACSMDSGERNDVATSPDAVPTQEHASDIQGDTKPWALTELPELGAKVRRRKEFTADGRLVVRSERLTDGGWAPISEDERRASKREDQRLRRARVGRMAEDFHASVSAIAARDPNAMVPVRVLVPIDEAKIPPRASADVSQTHERAAFRQTRLDAHAYVIATHLAGTSDTLARAGAIGLRHAQYLPSIRAEMPAAKVLELAQSADFQGIFLDTPKPVRLHDALSTGSCAINSQAVNDLGFNGGGSRIGIMEQDGVFPFSPCEPLTLTFEGDQSEHHGTEVASVAAGRSPDPQSVAPAAPIVSIGTFDIEDGLDFALNHGVDVVNMSFGTITSTGQIDSDVVMTDFLVRTGFLTVAISAGNDGPTGKVASPAIAYNVLAVGAYNDTNACSGGSVMSTFSSFGDPSSPHGDRNEPDLVAPGENVNGGFLCAKQTNLAGTSFSAPHVAGTAALLIQRDPTLNSEPETVRAILMATALDDIDPGSREKDGAGGLRADLADATARNSRFRALSFQASDFGGDGGTRTVINLVTSTTHDQLRVAIAWDSAINTNTSLQDALGTDFDLIVERDGVRIASNTSFDNSYEFVTINNAVPGTYTMKIQRFDGEIPIGDAVEHIGLAWGFKN